jgi:trans-aconitate methyltransferase
MTTPGERAPEAGWDAELYDRAAAFVWRHGSELIDLLAPQPGERVLDLGCGTGHLTAELAAHGARVVGLDNDPVMIEQARRAYPVLQFVLGDAADFRFAEPFDVVFSNAALHWVTRATDAAACIAAALRPGGRFVAELGGKGNVQTIVRALTAALAKAGYPFAPDRFPWYFPSIGEYASLLEAHGLEPVYATLFDRPTRLDGGEAGLRTWLALFAGRFFEAVPAERQAEIVRLLEERLRPQLFRDGSWFADYRRLRIVAVKRSQA